MSVKNLEKCADAIGNWIKDRITKAGATGAVVGLSGGADSALVALLCKRANVPLTCVLMPCGSSGSSVERAYELAKKFDLKTVHVDLGTAFESIMTPVTRGLDNNKPEKLATGALRSCLRAPTLDFVGKLTNSLIIGTGNRDEDEVTRYFQKRGDGCVDISPIAKLHKSEVYQLLKFLGCTQAIIDATPTADLWGPDSGQADEKEMGLTYPEVEWGVRWLNDPTKDLFVRSKDGVSTSELAHLTSRQLEIVNKLVKMEKATRHKARVPPVFNVRNTDLDLVD